MIGNDINGVRLVLSFDDCHPGNLEFGRKLADMGLVATFFLETMGEGAEEQAMGLNGMGHYIGCHTMHHPQDLKALSGPEIQAEIMASRTMIERWTESECLVLAYPRGRYNERVIEIAERCGIKEARTTKIHDLGPWEGLKMEMGTAVHAYSGRKEYGDRRWDMVARELWIKTQSNPNALTFHLWGHYKEMKQNGELGRLFGFLKEIMGV